MLTELPPHLQPTRATKTGMTRTENENRAFKRASFDERRSLLIPTTFAYQPNVTIGVTIAA